MMGRDAGIRFADCLPWLLNIEFPVPKLRASSFEAL